VSIAKEETAADIVAANPPPKTKPKGFQPKPKPSEDPVSLQKRISELEDELSAFKTNQAEAERLLEGARKAPSARTPGKSLLDEVNDFLGFGA
jgi:hypothetical protein